MPRTFLPSASLVLAMLALLSAREAAALDCPKGSPWTCFSEVTIAAPAYRVHIVFFDNREMRAEMEQAGKRRSLWMIHPDRPVLYAGMTPQEREQADVFEFMMPAADVSQALAAAFPDGPDSVPTRPTTRLQGTASVTAKRSDDGTVEFSIASARSGKTSGSLSKAAHPGLPDDYAVSDWELLDGSHLARLGEARRIR